MVYILDAFRSLIFGIGVICLFFLAFLAVGGFAACILSSRISQDEEEADGYDADPAETYQQRPDPPR